MKKDVTIAVRLPAGLAEDLDDLARETNRSRSYYVRDAIIRFLDERGDYLLAVALIEKSKPGDRISLEEIKRELGITDDEDGQVDDDLAPDR